MRWTMHAPLMHGMGKAKMATAPPKECGELIIEPLLPNVRSRRAHVYSMRAQVVSHAAGGPIFCQ
jgi:hypothetical protein